MNAMNVMTLPCGTCGKRPRDCTCFYIFSLRWNRGEAYLTWWGPNNSGYVTQLELAGRYAATEVLARRSYYNNLETTLAIPCVVVDAEAVLVVPDHALRRLTRHQLKPIVENYEPCPDCGMSPPSRTLGLRVIGEGEA